MTYELESLPGVVEDFAALPSSELQVIARDLLVQIREGVEAGRPLADLPVTGDLSDCRKVYFDSKPGPPGYRIVFRYLDGGAVEIVEIVAIGEPTGLSVSKRALERLEQEERRR